MVTTMTMTGVFTTYREEERRGEENKREEEKKRREVSQKQFFANVNKM